MRCGVFGGTFDPPHYGHLALATAALRQLSLDRVLWVVTADPPHKREAVVAPVDDRLNMVTAAIADRPNFELSRVDVDRPGPHWAVDTVALLRHARPEAELVYLMGSDSLRDLPTWGRPRELIAQACLGVLRRPGTAVDLAALEEALPGISGRVFFVSAPSFDVSSRAIRQLVAAGRSITPWVPPGVAAFIQARQLYQAEPN